MPQVLNAKIVGSRTTYSRIYVGRPSRWGNPFHIGPDGTREEVIQKYREWVVTRPYLMDALHELREKDLICWCAPESCHAEVLLELANPT